MADSKEEHGGGQASMLCQICEIARGIEWKCLDCDLLMCQKCKEKIHPKFKLANEHKIVNIKDVGNKEISSCEEEIHFGNIKCTEHCEETCCLYCQLCDKLICMQCVTKTHKSHIFEEIKCGYLIKKDNLVIHTKTLKNHQETLTNEIEKLEKLKDENNLKYRQVKKEITTHEKVVKEEVENYTLSLMNKLDENLDLMQQGTEKKIDIVKTMKVKIQEKLTKAEEFINLKDGTKFFQNIEEIEKSLKEDVQMTTFEKETLQNFVPGKLDLCNFGKLKSNNGTSDEDEKASIQLELSIGKEYVTSVSHVTLVVTSSDGYLWMCSQFSTPKLLMKTKPTGNMLQEITKHEIFISSMAVTPWNDILLCTNDNRVKRIDNQTGQLRNSKYNVGFLRPVSIFVKDNFTLVGAINRDYPEYGRRVVIKMNENGQHTHTAEFNENNQPIFIYPLFLACTNYAQEIFVIDGLSYACGYRIAMILKNNNIKYYTGHSSINSFNKPFRPMSIQAAPSNNIIVNDVSTNTLHILNQTGKLSAYMNLSDIGIQNGFSLCCNEKQLFIGSEYDQNKKDTKAKVYELNIQGCSHLVKT
ncbi:tripartite motif-containing protein 2-like [Mytilus edulis]|uniref:tripartite motif-containing protein 2-like n=1 Tax=Mytilus edulis TaxID=6550 RepID=UPI0039EE8E0C